MAYWTSSRKSELFIWKSEQDGWWPFKSVVLLNVIRPAPYLAWKKSERSFLLFEHASNRGVALLCDAVRRAYRAVSDPRHSAHILPIVLLFNVTADVVVLLSPCKCIVCNRFEFTHGGTVKRIQKYVKKNSLRARTKRTISETSSENNVFLSFSSDYLAEIREWHLRRWNEPVDRKRKQIFLQRCFCRKKFIRPYDIVSACRGVVYFAHKWNRLHRVYVHKQWRFREAVAFGF